jgi:hypothetical protein
MSRATTGPAIQLVLSDDWELRGDGSGNMRAIQFATIRRLCDVYEEYGLRGSFNVEVFQQLVHRRLQSEHPELAALSEEWEEVVVDTYRRGHDVQLHLHPQWSAAVYADGRWRLGASWALSDYSRGEASTMLGDAKSYLEGLLQPISSDYRCVSFRAGSWAIAPSPHALEVLADLGIVFDMSIVNGLYFDTAEVRIDYRDVEEPFLPYYPRSEDARRVGSGPGPIVCVPTHSFRPRLSGRVLHMLARRSRRFPIASRAMGRYAAASDAPIPEGGYVADYSDQTRQNTGHEQPPESGLTVSDLCHLTYAQMREVVDDIRRRAEATGMSQVPVILENHTKDIGDFAPFERFARMVARTPDLNTITSSELAEGLEGGEFPIKAAHEG